MVCKTEAVIQKPIFIIGKAIIKLSPQSECGKQYIYQKTRFFSIQNWEKSNFSMSLIFQVYF